jgi:hypothetical protein
MEYRVSRYASNRSCREPGERAALLHQRSALGEPLIQREYRARHGEVVRKRMPQRMELQSLLGNRDIPEAESANRGQQESPPLLDGFEQHEIEIRTQHRQDDARKPCPGSDIDAAASSGKMGRKREGIREMLRGQSREVAGASQIDALIPIEQ